MALSGIEVWFDEWQIQAGDSIPGRLNEGLEAFEAFVLLWSADAKRSSWVRQELNSAISRNMRDGSAKIIPCLLDETALPALIADRRSINFSDVRTGVEELLGELTGGRTKRVRLMAIQAVLYDMDVDWRTHPALPPLLCCPTCGETGTLEAWEQSDPRGTYAGLRCTGCRWSDGGEV
jgi:hypothetical protein